MLFSALFIYQYPPVNSFSMLRTSTVMYFLPIVSGSSTVNDRDIDGLSKKKNKKKIKVKIKKSRSPKPNQQCIQKPVITRVFQYFYSALPLLHNWSYLIAEPAILFVFSKTYNCINYQSLSSLRTAF